MWRAWIAATSMCVGAMAWCAGSAQAALDVVLEGSFLSFDLPGVPEAVVLEDLNRDGRPDLVLTAGPDFHVLLGRGDGTFQHAQSFQTRGGVSGGIAIGDLDGDLAVDLIVSNRAVAGGAPDSTVTVLLGTGVGTFGSGTVLGVGEWPGVPALADFDEDGVLDLAVATGDDGYVTLRTGNGAGAFGPRTRVWVGGTPRGATAFDADRDGHIDLIVLQEGAGGGLLSVLPGRGDGTFGERVGYATAGVDAQAMAIGDFNGDARSDVAVRHARNVILLENGGGVFFARDSVVTDDAVRAHAFADLDRDARDDLIYVSGTRVSVRHGNGERHAYAASPDPVGVAAADVDLDGDVDVVTVNAPSRTVSTYRVDDEGRLDAGARWFGSSQSMLGLEVRDMNRDGNLDVVYLDVTQVVIQLGDGKGAMTSMRPYDTGVANPRVLAMGDLDGDGADDAVIGHRTDCTPPCDTNGRVMWFRNDEAGGFDQLGTVGTWTNPAAIAVGDLDEDGFDDVIVAEREGRNGEYFVTPVFSLGEGRFRRGADVSIGTSWARSIEAADVNRDGHLDLVAAANQLIVLPGGGDGSFGAPVISSASLTDFVLADMNRDGGIDVVGYSAFSEKVDVLSGTGTGSFLLSSLATVGAGLTGVAVVELNDDGWPDVVATRGPTNTVSALLNLTGGRLGTKTDFGAGWGLPTTVTAGDMDGDDRPDVMIGNAGAAMPNAGILMRNRTTSGSDPLEVEIVSPVAGELWPIGGSVAVQWRISGGSGDVIVDVLLSRDGPDGPFEILGSNLRALGPLLWSVTGPESDSVFVRVVARDRSVQAEAAVGPVTIQEPIRLHGPNGGQTFAPGDPVEITWTSIASIERVDVFVSLRGPGGAFRRIGDDLEPAGSMTWVVGPEATEDARIKVIGESERGDRYADVSDGAIVLGDPGACGLDLRLEAPTDGDTLWVGRTFDIRWDADFRITVLDVFVSREGAFGPYEQVGADVPNDGRFGWFVSAPVTDDVHIMVVGRGDGHCRSVATAGAGVRIVQPPGPPIASFTAVATADGIAIDWSFSDPADIVVERLERSLDPTGPWSEVGTFGSEASANLLDRLLEQGRSYYYRLVVVDRAGGEYVFGPIAAIASQLDLTLALGRVIPHPMRDRARIEYAVPQAGHVRLRLLDIMGREIAMLADRPHAPGRYEVAIVQRKGDRKLPAGVYLLQLQGPGQSRVRTIVLVP